MCKHSIFIFHCVQTIWQLQDVSVLMQGSLSLPGLMCCYIDYCISNVCIHLCLNPQAYKAAMQTQWSWILQLCSCVEEHLKENTAYFEVNKTP